MLTGFHLLGCFTEDTGLTKVSREIALALYRKGVPTKISTLNGMNATRFDLGNVENQRDAVALQEMVRRPLPENRVQVLMRQPQYLTAIDNGALANVIYTTFETDRVPHYWYEIVRQHDIDEVWVPSFFNVKTFQNGGICKDMLHRIPNGYDPKTYHLDVEPFVLRNKAGFTFLSSFYWNERKAPEILLEAYTQEFKDEDVCLVIKLQTYPGASKDSIEKYVKVAENKILGYKNKNKSKARVTLMWDNFPESAIASLHKAADCYILPSRGEGWNLPALQSMACGVPVIVTDKSGHMDFCNANNSLLIDSEEKIIDNIAWLMKEKDHNGHKWFEPSIVSTRQQMRKAFSDRDLLSKLGKQAHQDVCMYTWDYAAEQFLKALLRIERERGDDEKVTTDVEDQADCEAGGEHACGDECCHRPA